MRRQLLHFGPEVRELTLTLLRRLSEEFLCGFCFRTRMITLSLKFNAPGGLLLQSLLQLRDGSFTVLTHARVRKLERVPDEAPQLIAPTRSDSSGLDAATTNKADAGQDTTLGRAGLSPIVCRKRSWLCGPSLLAWDFLACFFAACFFIARFLQGVEGWN